MNAITRQTIAIGIVFGLLAFVTNHFALAGALPSSDELLITAGGPTGPVVFDTLIPETPGPGNESSALFAPGAGLSGLQAPGALSGIVPPGAPGLNFVILQEPATEPPDAGELPPVMYPGANGPVVVSDLIISGSLVATAPVPFVALVSDNNPDLQAFVSALPPGVPILTETGALQDVTGFLGGIVFPGIPPVTIQVLSDVTVPEPSSFAFAAIGASALVAWRRRRTLSI
jgi:hypothetical protein